MAANINYDRFDSLAPGECLPYFGNRLHHACECGDLREVKRLLLIDDYKPNFRDGGGMTPLAFSASSGNVPCIRVLLADPRVDANLMDASGRTALIIAAEKGHLNAVKALRKVSVIDHEAHEGKMNALQSAAAGGYSDIVDYLSRWSDPRKPNSEGETALILAIESGNLACVRLLLPLSDAQPLDANGNNLLMRAAAYGRLNIVMELLPQFKLDAKNFDGKDALALAKHGLKGGWSEDPARFEATINFLSAYKHSLREMAQLSKIRTKGSSGASPQRKAARI